MFGPKEFNKKESDQFLEIFDKYQGELTDIKNKALENNDFKTAFDATCEYYKTEMSKVSENTQIRLVKKQKNDQKEMIKKQIEIMRNGTPVPTPTVTNTTESPKRIEEVQQEKLDEETA